MSWSSWNFPGPSSNLLSPSASTVSCGSESHSVIMNTAGKGCGVNGERMSRWYFPVVLMVKEWAGDTQPEWSEIKITCGQKSERNYVGEGPTEFRFWSPYSLTWRQDESLAAPWCRTVWASVWASLFYVFLARKLWLFYFILLASIAAAIQAVPYGSQPLQCALPGEGCSCFPTQLCFPWGTRWHLCSWASLAFSLLLDALQGVDFKHEIFCILVVNLPPVIWCVVSYRIHL